MPEPNPVRVLEYDEPIEPGMKIRVRAELMAHDDFPGLGVRVFFGFPDGFGMSSHTASFYSDPCKHASWSKVVEAEAGMSIFEKTELRLRQVSQSVAEYLRMEERVTDVYSYKPGPAPPSPIVRNDGTVDRSLPDEFRLPLPGSAKKVKIRARAYDPSHCTPTVAEYADLHIRFKFHSLIAFPDGWSA